MSGAIGAALVILAVFAGISALTVIVMAGVMLGVGRWTLPRSAERRVREARADVEIAELRHARFLMEERIDVLAEARLQRALGKGSGS